MQIVNKIKFAKKLIPKVPEEHRMQFLKLINHQNISRLKYVSIFAICILSFYLIDDIFITGNKIYVIADAFLWSVNILYLIYFLIYTPKKFTGLKNFHATAIKGYSFILINWAAYVSSIEFVFQEQVYSYLMCVFVVAIVFDFTLSTLILLLTSGLISYMCLNYHHHNYLIPPEKGLYIFIAHLICVVISRRLFAEKIKNFWVNTLLIENNNRLNKEIKDRLEVEEELKSLTQNLESRVEQRTQELESEIAHRKNTLDALAESREILDFKNYELQNLKKEMELFVYRTSHDIRGPISSVFGLLMLIKSTPDSEMQILLLQKIEKSMHQIDRFIQDILEYSDNSSSPICNNEINFYHVIESILHQIQEKYPSKMEVNIEINCPKPFVCDERRLRIVLKNLIDNAFMFQLPEKDSKCLDIKVNTDTPKGEAIVEVIDNGMGINKKCLPKVYQMFYRGTDKSKGSGLGLYITKLAVEKLNGTIDISSEIGQYTKVSFQLPHQIGKVTTYTSNEPQKVQIF